MYETIVGGPCLTKAEEAKLLARINANVDTEKVAGITGQWVFYVQFNKEAGSLDAVKGLLGVPVEQSTGVVSSDMPNVLDVYITPRNISPWSSKATSIAHVCNLQDQVRRIERGRVIRIELEGENKFKSVEDIASFRDTIYDRMTETISLDSPTSSTIFTEGERRQLVIVDIFAEGQDALEVLHDYNKKNGLGLDESNMEYLVSKYKELGRPPSDVELFMFAQVNSEHCRHHVFNSAWNVDGEQKTQSLFGMIKNTHQKNPQYTESAYSDNAAVMSGLDGNHWAPDYSTGSYKLTKETVMPLIKVETHNHPTAISPFPGAATGSGGEIRDEGAVGRGSTPKAGLCGFFVSDLHIPGQADAYPWEADIGRPSHYASAMDIMLEAPIGSARFNNEFGRPSLTGVFRTLQTNALNPESQEYKGYHKPIMIAGGVGSVRPQHALKDEKKVHEGAHVIVLGGPAMLIGLGGGAASSATGNEASAELDFASVQRGNPEMERRAQMVINTCNELGDLSPIAFIHDVGAGGLSNALPELVKDSGFGGQFELRQVESADQSMSPMEIFCNEAQERYVLLVNPDDINKFVSICRRERCGFSDVGRVLPQPASGSAKLILSDRDSKEHPYPIDLPMDLLFPAGRKQERVVTSLKPSLPAFDPVASMKSAFGESTSETELFKKSAQRVLHMPAVGSKSFLITIGDRTVGGLTTRDQMVGPWQTPVADVAVTATSFSLEEMKTGEAMAMGEKPTLALISAAASARMAVAESLLNLGAAHILGGAHKGDLERVKLSANWMSAVKEPGEGAALFEAVEAIGAQMCPQLGVSIPVGKDSMSMKASWKDDAGNKSVTAPMSVVISAFTTVEDIKNTWTPQLRRVEDVGDTLLMYVDLAQGRKALGGSALAQSFGQVGNESPDVRDVELLRDYFDAIAQLHESGIVLAYHDISDGGLFTTIAEMMFAGRCGVSMFLDDVAKSGSLKDMTEALFNEELGAVFQVRAKDEINFKRCFATCGPPPGLIKRCGIVQSYKKQNLTIRYGTQPVFASIERAEMQQWWAKTSYEMQKIRDNPACAESEYATVSDSEDPGISYRLTYSPSENIIPLTASFTGMFKRPRVAILREQGVNSYAEMAFAFKAAGFDPVDIHMSDILNGRKLTEFSGLAACGGFSYGDVLGAGQGWAKSVLLHENARVEFEEFFKRTNTFSLGVCNGCQALSKLKEIIPGASAWPDFVANRSDQFEARFSMVKVDESASPVFFQGMGGSYLPIAVSHGEGRASFSADGDLETLSQGKQVPVRYVDNRLQVTEQYPYNPNGSPGGVAAVSSADGRVLAIMPHPERTVMADVASYLPPNQRKEWELYGPWLRLFQSARRWIG
ncbi:phosphoribosylformylglycinamidine synthase [Apiospora marii]|uniref:phosphoribosylformylglycinamidine synthase n=1 Tax=Apiospora marii TaxID=335849 RepID=UPI00312FC83B